MKKLGRHLGLTGVMSVSMGAMIGCGLFVLPGLAAIKTGPSLWLAFLIAGALVLPAALTKAELATGMPGAGGTYLFIERSLGPLAGTIAGIGAGLSLMLKSCFALLGLTWYLGLLMPLPADVEGMAYKWIPIGILLLLTGLNMLGVAKVGRIQIVLVAVSLSALVILLVSAIPDFKTANLSPHFPVGLGGLIGASAYVSLSYAGVTKIAAIAEEVDHPSRNIPLGTMLSLFTMAILYAVTCIVMFGVIDWNELSGVVTPFAALASQVHGNVVMKIASVVAMLALVSVANATILTASRYPFALARDGLLPPALKHIHSRLLTPIPAIGLTALVMIAAILLLDVEKVVKLASGFQIFVFAVVNFSLIVFRESGASWYRPTFRSPLYPWVQVVGILGGLTLLVMLGSVALIGVAGFSLFSAVWYMCYGRRRAARTGLLQQVLSSRPIPPQDPTPEQKLPEARVVLALFGHETSSEALLEMANGLRSSADDRVDALLLQEFPEQTVLADLPGDDRTASFQRRLAARAEELQLPMYFEKIVTRDLRSALYEEALETSCEWVLMAYQRRPYAAFVRRPLEQLLARLPCDLALFKDAGVRAYRRILVLAEPGPHDVLIVRTANELARVFNAQLTFVEVLPEEATEDRVRAAADYHAELERLSPVPSVSLILRGNDRVEQIVHATVDFDLLVLGAGEDRPLRHLFFRPISDRIKDHATCSVLQLRTPPQRTHRKVETLETTTDRIDVFEHLSAPALRAGLAVRSKRALFHEIATTFARVLSLPVEEIEQAFWARERMQSTAMGRLVAIPHATLPEAGRTVVGIFTLDAPIDYQDGQEVRIDVCIATVGPPQERELHLKLLARLSKMMLETELLERLRAASDSGGLRAAVSMSRDELPD